MLYRVYSQEDGNATYEGSDFHEALSQFLKVKSGGIIKYYQGCPPEGKSPAKGHSCCNSRAGHIGHPPEGMEKSAPPNPGKKSFDLEELFNDLGKAALEVETQVKQTLGEKLVSLGKLLRNE